MLSPAHHALIQALLSHGPLEETHFFSIFAQVTGKSPGGNQEVFKRFLLDINKELAFVQFELRACRNQYNGKVYYGVVNNVSDEHSKIGTKYSPPQIAFYKGIIEAIVQDSEGQGSISNTSALCVRLENQVSTGIESESQSSQIPTAFKTFTMSQKEKTLEDFVRNQWLCLTSDGRIGLGVRSFLDLRSWFHSNEFPTCEVCNEAAVKAEPCQNEACRVRIHNYCLKKKLSQRKANKVCSGCGTELRPVAKAELGEEEDDPNVSSQNQQPPEQPSTRKRTRAFPKVEASCHKHEAVSGVTSVSVSDKSMSMRRSARLSAV